MYIASIFLNNLVNQSKKQKSKPKAAYVYIDPSMLKQKKIGWYGWAELKNGKSVVTQISLDLDNISDANLVLELPKKIQENLDYWITGKINV